MVDARAVGISGTGTKSSPTPADASVGECNNTQESGMVIYMPHVDTWWPQRVRGFSQCQRCSVSILRI